MRREIVILGGGISGLAAYCEARAKGFAPLLIEKSPCLGGLTRTVEIDDFCFDYTGHFLHLSRTDKPSELPYAGLVDSEWASIQRTSKCLVEGHLVTAPVQYNLRELPSHLRDRCLESFRNRVSVIGSETQGLGEFLNSGFGAYLSELFLIPQNEKTMAIEVSRLTRSAIKRFFPAADEEKVFAGAQPGGIAAETYNSRFWYPTRGGIGTLVDAMSRRVDPDSVRHDEVVGVNLAQRQITLAHGDRIGFDAVFSSLPLKRLCSMTSNAGLQESSARLSHSMTYSLNLGVRGELPEALQDAHWVYVPSRDVRFYRVGCFSNVAPSMAARHAHSLYIEASLPGDTTIDGATLETLQTKCLEGIRRLGWLDRLEIRAMVANLITCAYVHFTAARETVLPGILEKLRNAGINPVGRYGLWDYIGMEDSILSGIQSVREQI